MAPIDPQLCQQLFGAGGGRLDWRYLGRDGGRQGPFSADRMCTLAAQGALQEDTKVCGTDATVKQPFLPGTAFYRTLSVLLELIAAGRSYQQATRDHVKQGKPPPGWNEIPAGGLPGGPSSGGALGPPHPSLMNGTSGGSPGPGNHSSAAIDGSAKPSADGVQSDRPTVPIGQIIASLFTLGEAEASRQPDWRYINEMNGAKVGPVTSVKMIELFNHGTLKETSLVCAHTKDVKGQLYPSTAFYKPISQLAALVRNGWKYVPATKEQVRSGKPPLRWCEPLLGSDNSPTLQMPPSNIRPGNMSGGGGPGRANHYLKLARTVFTAGQPDVTAQPVWRYIGPDNVHRGAHAAGTMISMFKKGDLTDTFLVVGLSREQQNPNKKGGGRSPDPPIAFYRPLRALVELAEMGVQYKPVTAVDLARGVPEPGWCERNMDGGKDPASDEAGGRVGPGAGPGQMKLGGSQAKPGGAIMPSRVMRPNSAAGGAGGVIRLPSASEFGDGWADTHPPMYEHGQHSQGAIQNMLATRANGNAAALAHALLRLNPAAPPFQPSGTVNFENKAGSQPAGKDGMAATQSATIPTASGQTSAAVAGNGSNSNSAVDDTRKRASNGTPPTAVATPPQQQYMPNAAAVSGAMGPHGQPGMLTATQQMVAAATLKSQQMMALKQQNSQQQQLAVAQHLQSSIAGMLQQQQQQAQQAQAQGLGNPQGIDPSQHLGALKMQGIGAPPGVDPSQHMGPLGGGGPLKVQDVILARMQSLMAQNKVNNMLQAQAQALAAAQQMDPHSMAAARLAFLGAGGSGGGPEMAGPQAALMSMLNGGGGHHPVGPGGPQPGGPPQNQVPYNNLIFRVFTQQHQLVAEQPHWWMIGPADQVYGPFAAERMIVWFLTGSIVKEHRVCPSPQNTRPLNLSMFKSLEEVFSEARRMEQVSGVPPAEIVPPAPPLPAGTLLAQMSQVASAHGPIGMAPHGPVGPGMPVPVAPAVATPQAAPVPVGPSVQSSVPGPVAAAAATGPQTVAGLAAVAAAAAQAAVNPAAAPATAAPPTAAPAAATAAAATAAAAMSAKTAEAVSAATAAVSSLSGNVSVNSENSSRPASAEVLHRQLPNLPATLGGCG